MAFTEAQRLTSKDGNVHIHSAAYVALQAYKVAVAARETAEAVCRAAMRDLNAAQSRFIEAEAALRRALEEHYDDELIPAAIDIAGAVLLCEEDDKGDSALRIIKAASYSDLYRIECAEAAAAVADQPGSAS